MKSIHQRASMTMSCEACPAKLHCHNDSLPGQVARVLAERQPAIVRSMRLHSLLKSEGSQQRHEVGRTESAVSGSQ